MVTLGGAVEAAASDGDLDSAKNLPTVSVVVSTFNRLPYLKKLLRSLGHLQDDDFELIVVNGPSTDGTEEYLSQWTRCAKILDCEAVNLSRSRNIGLAAATGEIIVFIDDDAVPAAADWIHVYREFFDDPANKGCAAVGSVVLGAFDGNVEFFGGSTSEFAEQSPQNNSLFRPPSGGWVVRGVMGCNCAMRASALRDIGGFDENISYYLDETDVCFRLSARGYQIKFLDRNPVHHASAPSSFRKTVVRKRWRVIFRSDTYFCWKNSEEGFLRKIAMILKTAGRKHFLYLARHARSRPPIRRWQWVRYTFLSYAGIVEGLWRGIFTRRRLLVVTGPAPRRVRFEGARPLRKLRIGLVSRTLPGMADCGGPGQHTEALANGLYGLGHEIHIFARPTSRLPSGGVDYWIHHRSASIDDPAYFDPQLPSTSQRLGAAVDYQAALEELARNGSPLDFVIGCNWDSKCSASSVRASTR